MSISDLAARLDDILAAIHEIETFAAGKPFDDYMADAMLRRAVERDVEIISEALRYIPDDLKARHPTIPWRKVAGVGNVLRQGYKLIDDHEMWDVVTHDLAPLKATIESMLLEVDLGRYAESGPRRAVARITRWCDTRDVRAQHLALRSGRAGAMPRRGSERKLPLEFRLLWWLIRLTWKLVGQLSYWLLAAVGLLLWLIARPLRRPPEVAIAWPPADAFYRSHRWRRLRIDALEANRERYGTIMCECCLTGETERWHVDHIRPRSTHPELALEPANLQVLCADCNLGKGTRHSTDWRAEKPA